MNPIDWPASFRLCTRKRWFESLFFFFFFVFVFDTPVCCLYLMFFWIVSSKQALLDIMEEMGKVPKATDMFVCLQLGH